MSPTRNATLSKLLEDILRRREAGEDLPDELIIETHAELLPELAERLRDLAWVGQLEQRAIRGPNPVAGNPGITAPSPFQAESIAGYRLLEEVHRGGQGVVYRATHLATGREVAIKVMRDGPFLNPLDYGRFEREVRILAQLKHPNIVTVFDRDTAHGSHFFVMDYVDGQTLDAFVAERRSISETLGLFAKIAEAVSAAHVRGIIHRDLKPGNIMVDHRGEPRILDFGLAKLSTESDQITRSQTMTLTGQFVGSLPWASPEQADGSPDEIDLRTDVYSLGVVFYHMLTERFPYAVTGKMRDVLHNILETAPIRPRLIRKDIDDELETIVLKCLAKEPQRRYQSAAELARDVDRYLAGEPIEAKRESTMYVLRKRVHQYRTALATMAAFVVLLLAAVGVSWRLYTLSQKSLWQAHLDHARMARGTGALGQRFDSLDAISKAAAIRPAIELRNEAIAALALPDVRVLNQWTPDGGPWETAFFSPTLDHYVLVSLRRGIASVRRISDDVEIWRVDGLGRFYDYPVFSHDGNLVALGDASSYVIRDLRTDDVVPTVAAPKHDLRQPAFDHDNRLFAVSLADGVHLYNLDTHSERVLRHEGRPRTRVCFSPDDSRLAVWHQRHNEVDVQNVETGDIVHSLEHPDTVWAVAWNSTNDRLATTCDDKNVYVWNAQTGELLQTLEGHDGTAVFVAFGPEDKLVISSGWDQQTRVWGAEDGKQILVLPFITRSAMSASLQFLAQLGGGGGPLITFRAELRLGLVTKLNIQRSRADANLWSGFQATCGTHGRLLYWGRENGLRICDIVLNRQIGALDIGWVTSVASHPTGDLITSGHSGAFRWPVRRSSDHIRIGPPDVLARVLDDSWGHASLSEDGSKLAICIDSRHVLVLDSDDPDQQQLIADHERLRFVSIDRNGSRIATSSWHSSNVRVWDTQIGELIRELPCSGAAITSFSPDGQYLIVNSRSDVCVWDLQTGQKLRCLARDAIGSPTPTTFLPDRSTLAIANEPWSVEFCNVASLDSLAEFTMTDRSRVFRFGLTFTPDGGTMIATPETLSSLLIWNIRGIRNELARIGLDWDLPPLPPAPAEETVRPLQVHIDLGALESDETRM